ncbi:hypothetical protein R6Q59_034861 [Mikania micrantha]
MFINNQTLLLIIVFSLFALCIDGNIDNTRMDPASLTDVHIHKVSQPASTSNQAVCFPKFNCERPADGGGDRHVWCSPADGGGAVTTAMVVLEVVVICGGFPDEDGVASRRYRSGGVEGLLVHDEGDSLHFQSALPSPIAPQTKTVDISLTGSKGNRKSRRSSSDRFPDDSWEKDSYKVKVIDAIQVLQDIFLKADSRDLQAEHKFLLGPEQDNGYYGDDLERQSNSSSFKKHLDSKDAIISSPKLLDSSLGKFSLFETESTVSVAWDCLFYLLKKAEENQVTFRSANGVNTALPFLVYDIHRPGVLRVLSCLIIEVLHSLVDMPPSGKPDRKATVDAAAWMFDIVEASYFDYFDFALYYY